MPKKYKLQIDGKIYEHDDCLVYDYDILALAGRGKDFVVNIKYHGRHDRKRLVDNSVSLDDRDIQRFETMKLAATGG